MHEMAQRSGAPQHLPVAPTDEPPARRLVRGLVVIDKPAGCTSHDVVDRVRRLVRHKKVGHAGTLDPEVTGVLPIGLGQATRVLDVLLRAGKTYDTHMLLHADVPADRVREVLASQVGTISQMPPVRSRVKRQERQRDIYELRIDDVAGRHVRFTVRCEAGTYIRKLCHDVGGQLGCGAHMAGLRRTHAGGFSLADAVTLDAFAAALDEWRAGAPDALAGCLYPLEAALPADWPRIWLDDGAVPRVANGMPLYAPGVIACTDNVVAGGDVALMTRGGHLVALGTAARDADEARAATRGESARPRRAFWPLPDA